MLIQGHPADSYHLFIDKNVTRFSYTTRLKYIYCHF
ncbi:MAG TPA: hypothetical protein DEF41_02480 [Desulfovibrio sp.]|uniref:Uncharacterized protein n=1 Tax=Nitratidesulfovibrio vulgaris (strain ATCC 29579 / DSM 644 / CCUG 34227 / NCIMB 8303 / VKM B-1760 / Hildenborough) TaxID=882 RepID=Q725Y6_NITV2|nr:hypothetical protein DVU_3288 [Nitratidesulfovibrio vulgaris str. Hildenborough]HBW15015.1 hypothetical protein [Desulfovibrio sp.]